MFPWQSPHTFIYSNYNLEKNTKINQKKEKIKAGTNILGHKDILPKINSRMNEHIFSNNKIHQNEQLNPAKRKKSPFTIIQSNKMNLDINTEKQSGKPYTMINSNKKDIDLEKGNTREKEKGKTFVKENKNKIELEKENTKEKAKTMVKDYKNDMDLEIENVKEKAKTEIILNNINIDNNFKISRVKNKPEEKNNIIYNNSTSELRLPKELIDISFDNPHNK